VSEASSPLAGCRVLEIARFITGPFAGQLLADLGADVIKIEDPQAGDPFRGWGDDLYAPQFVAYNRGKRSLTVDLRHPRGPEIVRRLARSADVLIANFRPGVAERFGIGYDQLKDGNPRLIYCLITGMGETGPYVHRPSYDTVGQGLSGLLSLVINPNDPRPVGPSWSDNLTGLFAAYGILAALQARERTGRGQRVDTNQVQATMAFMNEAYAVLFDSGKAPDPFRRPAASQAYAFTCKDGLGLAVHLSSPEKFWRGFIETVGRPELADEPRYVTRAQRVQHWAELQEELRPAFLTKTRAEWLEALDKADVPVTPIYTLDEALADPQVQTLRMVHEIEHPNHGRRKVIGSSVTLRDTPVVEMQPAPALGEHTDEVLGEAGLSADEIAALRGDGAI
jgi:crotonobetainyl-CoA:carnitine CoA-transferase CaiB-like acyl-CoA transferase